VVQDDPEAAAPAANKIIVAGAGAPGISAVSVAELAPGLGWMLAITAPGSAFVISIGTVPTGPGSTAAFGVKPWINDPWNQAVGRAPLNDYDAALLLPLTNEGGLDQPSWDAAVLSNQQRNPDDRSGWPGRPDARTETRANDTVPAEPLQEAAVGGTVLDRLFAQMIDEAEAASDNQDGN
jgi:hypothetical protein